MAVRAVGLGRATRVVRDSRRAAISYVKEGQVWQATKLPLAEFDQSHRRALATAHLNVERELVFETPGWKSCWIGAGEEKAVFLVVDPQERAFALEILAKGTYLEGHLTEGHYLADLYVPGLAGTRWDKRALFGHIFSGHVKAREFIYGDTLAGPGLRQVPVAPVSFLKRFVGQCGKMWTHWMVWPRYGSVRRRYRDAHEANVMIELIPLHNPEKKTHYILPVPWLEEDGRLHLRYYRLTPIDVRIR